MADDIFAFVSARFAGQTGLVYTLTTSDAETIARELGAMGLSTDYYHAGPFLFQGEGACLPGLGLNERWLLVLSPVFTLNSIFFLFLSPCLADDSLVGLSSSAHHMLGQHSRNAA